MNYKPISRREAQLLDMASGGCSRVAPSAQSKASICVAAPWEGERIPKENWGGSLRVVPLVATACAVGRLGGMCGAE